MIVQHPSEVLSAKCAEVQLVSGATPSLSGDTQELIRHMLKVLSESGGVGLAAPQVGSTQRIVVVDFTGEKPQVMINPVISKASKKSEAALEECLSIPGRKFRVFRAKSIWVTFTNSSGIRVQSFLQGYEARVVQHEVDHLNGVTIAERGIEVL